MKILEMPREAVKHCYAHDLPTPYAYTFADILSASYRNFRGTSGMSMSVYGFSAMMTHVLSFPIQALDVVQRNLEEVPRSIPPVRSLS